MIHRFEGADYAIEEFAGDDGPGWHVKRDGGELHQVRTAPPACDCGDFVWKRDGLLPVPCRHIRAVRDFLRTPSAADRPGPAR